MKVSNAITLLSLLLLTSFAHAQNSNQVAELSEQCDQALTKLATTYLRSGVTEAYVARAERELNKLSSDSTAEELVMKAESDLSRRKAENQVAWGEAESALKAARNICR